MSITFREFLNQKSNTTITEDDVGGTVDVGTNSTTNVDTAEQPMKTYKRIEIPQIKGELYGEFVNDLKLNDVQYDENIDVDVDKVEIIQNEFNAEKVERMANDYQVNLGLYRPIILSKDLKLIDGKHRFLAMKKLNQKNVKSHIVGLTKDELFSFFANKPYVINAVV